MPRSRGLRSTRTSVPSRRKASWDEGPFGRAQVTSNVLTIIPTGQAAGQDGLTIVRIRGELLLALSTVTAALDGFRRCACGIGIFDTKAFSGVGVTAMPGPLTEMDWNGWLWHWTGAVTGMSTTTDGNGGSSAARIVIDTKAMRKIGLQEVVGAVFETSDEVGTAVLEVYMSTRMLAKLP